MNNTHVDLSGGAGLRVAFAGTPEFAQVALKRLFAQGHTVPLVLTQPDRPAGRGMKLQASAVKSLALAHSVPVVQPRSLRLDGKFPEDAVMAQQALLQARVDVMVVAAYGLILPQWVLSLPRWGCLNIHASLLPRWRGAAPIHRAIEAGDLKTGITLMQMDVGLDTGDMVRVESLPIRPDDTTSRLHDRLAELGARLMVEVLEDLGTPKWSASPQPDHGVAYAHKIEKHEAWIDWRQNASEIERRVRAFDPFPGSVTLYQGKPLKVWRAECVSGQGVPGEVLVSQPGMLKVACGEGALNLLELQRPGGKRLPTSQCFQSNPPEAGSKMEMPVHG